MIANYWMQNWWLMDFLWWMDGQKSNAVSKWSFECRPWSKKGTGSAEFRRIRTVCVSTYSPCTCKLCCTWSTCVVSPSCHLKLCEFQSPDQYFFLWRMHRKKLFSNRRIYSTWEGTLYWNLWKLFQRFEIATMKIISKDRESWRDAF